MVQVPSGVFWQGCNDAVDTNCEPSERPYHEVKAPGFEIDEHEVTVAQYKAFVEALGTSLGTYCDGGTCTPEGTTYSSHCNWGMIGREEHPINCITWYQAQAFCEWAGKRLCSESEWEKAARGTDGRIYPWGNEEPTCEYAVMSEGGLGCGAGGTMVVGSMPAGASPYGALDMSGNVWEWVEDDYYSDYTGAPTDGSTWMDSPRAAYRVIRGGSFDLDFSYYLRSLYRAYYDPAYTDYDVGARCCRSQ